MLVFLVLHALLQGFFRMDFSPPPWLPNESASGGSLLNDVYCSHPPHVFNPSVVCFILNLIFTLLFFLKKHNEIAFCVWREKGMHFHGQSFSHRYSGTIFQSPETLLHPYQVASLACFSFALWNFLLILLTTAEYSESGGRCVRTFYHCYIRAHVEGRK